MGARAKAGKRTRFAVWAIFLATFGLALLTGCRDDEPPPKPVMDDTPVDLSGERRRQAHAVSEGGPERDKSADEAPFQGPADGDVDAAGYGEGYVPPAEDSEDDDKTEDDEAEDEPLEP